MHSRNTELGQALLKSKRCNNLAGRAEISFKCVQNQDLWENLKGEAALVIVFTPSSIHVQTKTRIFGSRFQNWPECQMFGRQWPKTFIAVSGIEIE